MSETKSTTIAEIFDRCTPAEQEFLRDYGGHENKEKIVIGRDEYLGDEHSTFNIHVREDGDIRIGNATRTAEGYFTIMFDNRSGDYFNDEFHEG